MTSLRFGLAGLGLHGARYASHLLDGDVSGASLAAVSRANAREGALYGLAHGVTYVADPRELATFPGLDAVIVCLPPDLHPPVVHACLESGRPVLVEKPLAPTAAEADAIVAAVAATGTPLMVAQTLRFDPLIEAIRRHVPSIAPIRVLALSQRFEPTTRSWIDTPGRGGALLNTGVHSFDLLRHLSGAEIVSVRAVSSAVLTTRTEDTFAAIARLEPGGILATIDNARTTAGRSGRIEIAGQSGQLRADFIHRELARLEGRARVDLGPVEGAPTVRRALEAFAACLSSGTPMPVTASDGAAAVRAVEAAARSAAQDGLPVSP